MATLESELSLPQWRTIMRTEGWNVAPVVAGLRLQLRNLDLSMDGEGFVLLHGTIGELEQDVTQIKDLLRGRAQLLQLDVFEEDGRMVKRLTHI